MEVNVDEDKLVKWLAEAIDGTVMGVSIGDHLKKLRERLDEPDAYGHIGRFVIYDSVEFSIGDNDTVEMIYVEVPDDVFLKCDALTDKSSYEAEPDSDDVLVEFVGKARLCFDRDTMRVLSFSIWPSV